MGYSNGSLSNCIRYGMQSDTRISKNRLLFFERWIKGFVFDCQMCGQCVLSSTGMSCPMNCPKTLRNGPCGGVRPGGYCEVKPEMRCVLVEAWDGSLRMRNGNKIKIVQQPVNVQLQGSLSWLRIAREKSQPVQQRKHS